MKKILFISHALPPYLYPQSIQIGRFLRHLKSRYDIYILCAEEKNTPVDRTLYPDIFSGIDDKKILKIPYTPQPRLNYVLNRLCPVAVKHPDQYTAWSATAYDACVAHFPDAAFDIVLTFSFPLSLNILGRRLKDHYNCRWIAHQSDPWVDNPFLHLGPVTRWLNNRMEKACYSHADKLVFTCAEAESFMKAKYPALADRMTFIDHSFDPKLYPAPSAREKYPKVIRYIGNFYGRRTVKPLLQVLPKLSAAARKNLRFQVTGANLKTKLMIRKAALPGELLTATGSVNYQESLRQMVNSDVLLIIDAPFEKDNIFFPCKLVDYIGSNRPIIGICSPGPTDRILKSLGHSSYRHDQIDELANLFEQIASGLYHPEMGHETERMNYLDTQNSYRFADLIDHA